MWIFEIFEIQKVKIVILLSVVLVISSMFYVKNKVSLIQKEIKMINNAIEHEETNIKILEAEFNYLLKPVRLQNLSAKYLNLYAPKLYQITSNPKRSDIKICSEEFDKNIVQIKKHIKNLS